MHPDNLDETSDSNISVFVNSDYLPYSSESIHDNTQLEDANNIRVITGNRVDWSDNGNLPADWMFKQQQSGWSDRSILPENWNLTNPNVDWHSPLPEGWRDNNQRNEQNHNSDLDQGWGDDNTLPKGWKSKGNNITVRRDNRCILASKLPTIFVTNH